MLSRSDILSSSRTNCIGHFCAASPQRLGLSRGAIACGLVFHLGIEFCPKQYRDRRYPEPCHEADNCPERAVGFIEVPKVGRVERKQRRRGKP